MVIELIVAHTHVKHEFIISSVSHLLTHSLTHLQTTLPPPTGVSNGNELTKEMFRWDQRLFTVLLKFPGILCSDSGIIDDDIEEDSTYLQMSSLCEYTGGKEKWMDGWMDG